MNTPEDFLDNEHFRRWVRYRRDDDRIYWEDFLSRYPEKRPAYENAVATLLVIYGHDVPDSDDGAGRLRDLLNAETRPRESTPLWRWLRWSAAAMLAIGLGFWWSRAGREAGDVGRGVAQMAAATQSEWVVRQNDAQAVLLVNLPDGSSVLLSNGSRIRFGREMNGAERDVYLDGEGFFEVVKNPAKPFLVHTDKLTTRVLGTSFRVKSFPGHDEAEVAVKTGRVAVTTIDREAAKPLMLYPNQRMSLVRKNDRLLRAVKDISNTDIVAAIDAEPFDFQFTPVSEAFKILETNYAVKIRFDEEKMSHCTVTAALKDEPFLEKIRLICLATETSFVLNGDEVTISGAGCP